MNIIIDVREEDEVKQKYLVSNDKNKVIINVPSSIIYKHIASIVNLSQNKGNIYLVCRSGNRSDNIKNQYFKHINNIFSVGSIENASKMFQIKIINKN